MRRLLILLAASVVLVHAGLAQAAKDASPAAPTAREAPATTPSADPPPKVRQLLDLMNDAQVRAWLEQRKTAPDAPSEATPSHADTVGLSDILTRFAGVRSHVNAVLAAFPRVADEVSLAVENITIEFERQDLWRVLRLLTLFIALGYGAQRLFRFAVNRFRLRLEAMTLDTVSHRLNAVILRLVFSIGMVVSFAIGSVGAFLAFDWPVLLRGIVLGYLLAFLAVRLAVSFGHFLLAPGSRHFSNIERFRIAPIGTPEARYWYWRLVIATAFIAFAWVTLDELVLFGISEETRELLSYAFGAVVLAAAVEAVWVQGPANAVEEADARHRRHARATWLSFYFVALWLLWVSGAMTVFWLVALAVGLPAAIKATDRSVNHILRPPGHAEAGAGPTPIAVVCLERGLRSFMIVGAIAWLAYVWQIDVGDIASRDTLLTRTLRGVLSAAVVVLLADFVWNVAKALIDAHVAEAATQGEVSVEDERRRSRLRTLLPILRNMLFIVIIVLAIMMGLSALGVQIGPLIASAGVVGVAIGFGAQTLVKDIISGIFYLLDDAFRVGEYIQSGNYRGVVESFSLRSVKLRHQNGPLFTVPFGVLGAVQNQSRDWAVTKLTIGVTYDTDLDKARKILKKVGQELAADPELGPGVLQPLKMQGVQAFGDFALQLRLKMMTKPGDVQYMARRRALGLIKKAFDANGIKFASPMVQVAGSSAGSAIGEPLAAAAAAHTGLGLVKPAVAE